jgi:hypothetical protein
LTERSAGFHPVTDLGGNDFDDGDARVAGLAGADAIFEVAEPLQTETGARVRKKENGRNGERRRTDLMVGFQSFLMLSTERWVSMRKGRREVEGKKDERLKVLYDARLSCRRRPVSRARVRERDVDRVVVGELVELAACRTEKREKSRVVSCENMKK